MYNDHVKQTITKGLLSTHNIRV